jgi:hypothetical protein
MRKSKDFLGYSLHCVMLIYLAELICGNLIWKAIIAPTTVSIPRARLKNMLRLRGAAENVDEGKLTYSIKDMQKGALEELIARAIPDNVTVCGPWKTLFFDEHWRDVFTMALKPSELHLHGVICYQLLDQPKDDLPEYPAVFFVNTEHTNISLLASDMNKDLFESVYMYSSGPTALEQWDDFCTRVDPELFISRVRTVSDVFADFISLGVYEKGGGGERGEREHSATR